MRIQLTKRRILTTILITTALAAGLIVSLMVFADSEQITFTATAYSDVIRFEAYGVGSLQVRIYDMAENELWDSGQVSTDFADWERTNEWGERLANGYYIYFVQAWSNADEVVLSKTGKVVLLPGDQVQLQSAPVVGLPQSDISLPSLATIQPMGLGDTGVFYRVGIGTNSPANNLHVLAAWPTIRLETPGTGVAQMSFVVNGEMRGFFQARHDSNLFRFGNYAAGGEVRLLTGGNNTRMTITAAGNVGIGTTSPAAKLEVESSTSQDLIAAYPSSSRAAGSAVFVVKNTGEVRADGTVYAADFQTGSADVAERINTSEWVEAGDVVEIDPDHPGFFRKAIAPYSRRVAGIISTSPGVILGNSSDPMDEEWEDSRPVLAIAGRVPCKVSTENGPIQIGDLLVSSSTSGIAMKGDSGKAIGAVVGKAMEPLNESEGTIMVQVMLR